MGLNLTDKVGEGSIDLIMWVLARSFSHTHTLSSSMNIRGRCPRDLNILPAGLADQTLAPKPHVLSRHTRLNHSGKPHVLRRAFSAPAAGMRAPKPDDDAMETQGCGSLRTQSSGSVFCSSSSFWMWYSWLAVYGKKRPVCRSEIQQSSAQ
jgi:hypothetical protein